jgi:sigma-B regulation protein RsbU (phosphoserine phosphatase)
MNSPDQNDGISILIAEDSRIQAAVLSNKLREAGYEVRTAENGQIGLDMIRQERPTLVISDIEMPAMTGYELCSAVKSDPELRTIPFILLSTLSDAQDIIKGLHCGADNYVTKPYDPEYLIARVNSLLGTPLADDDEDEQQLDVTLGGTRYTVKAGRQQVLNLLVSTFENAVEKNRELIRLNEELTVAKEQLTHWNQELESLNEKLDSANARMSRDLEAAAKVQQSLLPTSAADDSRVSLAWKYLPCDELAGDFLNHFALDDKHIAVYVVDVSGHGVASSLLAVAIGRMLTPQVSTSSLLVQGREGTSEIRVVSPAEVAAELNRRFPMEEQNGLYFTMVYGVLDLETLEFRFVSAGHDPVVHVSRSGVPYMVEGDGVPIGWFEDMEYDEHVVKVQPGDRLYLYSDGVPEAMNGELDQFTMKQMLEIMELGQTQALDDSVSLLLNAVERWCVKNGPKDDVSILGLEISSASGLQKKNP